MEQIAEIRSAVADALEQRGHGNREFLRQVRDGEQDDGPFMQGALAWARCAENGSQPRRPQQATRLGQHAGSR
ncbi:hypothetical protein LWE61_08180 [Sphingobium sufflavum]|uniref:hypothetical protein n=1 Tax=Sphingobium sufflavum TaxID=1129547 RepID=UPI001F351237|nr:hypothetical protein [Sphingobium sufflavum]MCE7796539.1 hypothetical protein [Sphingobium sufflavum]